MTAFLKCSLLLVCAALACLVANQQTLIRTSVHVVEVSVIATDSKGLPVSGLGLSDFRVFDNGKEQAIATFERIDSHTVPGRAELPPDTYSNRLAGAGAGQLGKAKQPQVLSMILLDGVNTKYRNQTVSRGALESVLEQIEPDERVAIYAFGSRFRTIHDFSSDRASLLARLKAYHGEVPQGDDMLEDFDLDEGSGFFPPAPPQFKATWEANRIVDTLAALEAIANHVKGVPGRKNLLWLSAAFPLTVGQPGLKVHGAPAAQWQTFDVEMKRTMAALNDANVSVYPIDVRGLSKKGLGDIDGNLGGLTLAPSPSVNVSTMMQIADATGGKAYYNRNDYGRGVRLALEDSREVYVLTYYPKSVVEDGAYHSIRVRSTRPGVQLRFRRGYYATANDEGAAAKADRLAGVVMSPLDNSEIGMQASVETGENGDLTVVVHVDPSDLSLAHATQRWTGSLRLDAVQVGSTGKLYQGASQTAQLDLSAETYQRALEQGLRFELRLKREPAAIAVRVGAVDERGVHVGSLSVPLSRAGR